MEETPLNEKPVNYAANAGAIRAFLSSPEKFPGLVIDTKSGKTWLVNDEGQLKTLTAEFETHMDRGNNPLKVEPNTR